MDTVKNLLVSAVFECISSEHISTVIDSGAFAIAHNLAMEDLDAYASKDPASVGKKDIVAMSSLSYSAVLHYRLASALMTHQANIPKKTLELYAAMITSRGKLKSGAEIHYSCKIGRRVILDHGFGTVIGETSVIGDDCYLLGGITLGAKGISNNPGEARHPIIGNNVQIGAFSRILGRIKIGDGVFIGPGCTVISDVPDGAKILNKEYRGQELLLMQG